MADIAQIGFAADTSALDKATASLEKMVPATAGAEAGAANVSAALTKVNNAAKGVTTTTAATSKVVQAATGAINQQAKGAKDAAAANDNAAKSNDRHAASHKGLSTQAMAAQHSIRSMVEQIAMGVPPTQVLSTQLNHLAYAASGPGGIKQAFGDALGALTKLFSVTAVVVTGILAVAAAFVFAANSVIKSTLAMDDLSKSTDIAYGKVHQLQQLASFKGISNDEFAGAMEKFSLSVAEAKENVGALNGLMIASGKSAKDTEGYFMQVASLVSQTNSGVQKRLILEAAGLPTTQAWVRLMSQGPEKIKEAINGTVGFNEAAEKNLVQKARDFDDAWNKATTKMVQYFKSGIVDIVSGLSNMEIPGWLKFLSGVGVNSIPIVGPIIGAASAAIGMLNKKPDGQDLISGKSGFKGNTGYTPDPYGTVGADPKTQQQLLEANRQASARISILGDLATADQVAKQKQLELNAAGLQGVGVSKEMADKIVLATRAQDEQNRVNQQAQAGIFNLAAAQKAAADTLQTWINKGLVNKDNSAEMAAAQLVLARNIKATSDAAAVAAAPLQQLKQLELDSSNFAKVLDTGVTGALTNLVSPIQDVMNGVTGISAGFKNMGVIVLKAIQEMIIKMLILAPIARGLQGIFSGFTGGFNPLAGAFSFGKSALGNVFGSTTKFANGGAFTNSVVTKPTFFQYANGAAFGQMGEKGPEAIMPLKRGPGGSLGVQMYGQGHNDNSSISLVHAPQYNIAQGADPAAIAELRKAQEDDRKKFAQNAVNAVVNARRRGAKV